MFAIAGMAILFSILVRRMGDRWYEVVPGWLEYLVLLAALALFAVEAWRDPAYRRGNLLTAGMVAAVLVLAILQRQRWKRRTKDQGTS